MPVNGLLLIGTLCWKGFSRGVQALPLLISNIWHGHYSDFEICWQILCVSLSERWSPRECWPASATCFWQIECDFWTLTLGTQPPLCEEAHSTRGGCVLTYSPGWGSSQQPKPPNGHGRKKLADNSSSQHQAALAENKWSIDKLPCSYWRFVSEKNVSVSSH